MDEAVELNEEFAVIAEAEPMGAPMRVLKQGESFGVFDPCGDIGAAGNREEGLYFDGTRFLSRLELSLFHRRPLLLSSTISRDNAVFVADLTNPDLRRGDRIAIPRGQIHLVRARVLWSGQCVERIRVANYSLSRLEVTIAIRFDADFNDLFEVRGARRLRSGQRLPDVTGPDYYMRYRGLDGVERRTRVRWNQPPATVAPGYAAFVIDLEPHASAALEVTIGFETASAVRPAVSYEEAVPATRAALAVHKEDTCIVRTSNATFNRWLNRSIADLQMLMTDTPSGVYPYAGIPWYSTPFGRDGLITAFELLWAAPRVARGVLTFLANTQATTHSAADEMQPGKIIHEMRGGEMAALGEVPFGRYYGSADATPLFVMLAGAYYERTADRSFIDHLWPNIVSALEWMHTYGDLDGDGFIEYARHGQTGLIQQGWKDSYDSVFHANGELAEEPIAICEVQAYAYAAWTAAVRLASVRGDDARADEWHNRAKRMRTRFEAAFWSESLGTYVLALDRHKRPCQVITSNPGHCLFAGIATEDRADRVRTTLMNDASFAGWGIRTVAAGEARYNPMSYHNGSIWPHDNAIIAAGFSRYGHTRAAARILDAMFDLSGAVDLHRLPELICGFERRGDEHPTLYPVACAPQAWAAGAVYLLLAASLGLAIDARSKRLSFSRAQLPREVDWIELLNLCVGDANLDLRLERHPHDVGVIVLRRAGDLDICSIK
ncbi:MAG: amylo-alpha-1,6-glucosidase [Acidobacteria bacterium]|nr:MAG: amylo-alpha-1,6-glucosidase [Acidobacteriota bacterium]